MGEDPTLHPVFTSYMRKDSNTLNKATLFRGVLWQVNFEDKISKVEYDLDPDNDDAKVEAAPDKVGILMMGGTLDG